ncbi:MAG: PHP domain-containing protein [Bdellovibrionales bacterium]|nr:PHP domain-containing protein [Bdellovibrionales bacterium]
MNRLLTAALFALILPLALGLPAIPALALGKKPPKAEPGRFATTLSWDAFYKGNTHTHTLRSDGDSLPETVIRWYRDRNYQFLVMTDHDRASTWEEFQSLEIPGGFVVVPGEEISYAYDRPPNDPTGRPKRSVHVSQLCGVESHPAKKINPAKLALERALGVVLGQPGAVAIVNHPNYEWGLSLETLRAVPAFRSMEIANQHAFVANPGDANHPSTESLWDSLLSDGRDVYGVASDDMHDLVRTEAQLGYKPRRGGLGWIQVAAAAAGSLDARALCAAIDRGDYYSSTGVELARMTVSEQMLKLELKAAPAGATTEFIGSGGRLLARAPGASPEYRLAGGEGYVRARVRYPDGKQAWTQAFRVLQ